MTDFTLEPLSEDALLLRFGDGIDPATNARVHAAARALRDAHLPGLIDIAPAYASLLLRFDPSLWIDSKCARPFERITAEIARLDPGLRRDDELGRGSHPETGFAPARTIEIPVCYGGEYGPDLEVVAAHARTGVEDVVARHAGSEYIVAMLGFAPGFPYLLGLDPILHTPRRATPRTRVPAGSVSIGGAQTGIYPRELPGGWQVIGRTPMVLFDPQRDPPCLLAPADRVRFRAIRNAQFERLREKYSHEEPAPAPRDRGRSQQ
ncbi:MAG: 5-oxoprolinase subunit PxpB [Rhodanobacteraceae bacterium]